MKKRKYGDCKLCGKKCELTYEHVPPKSAFNNSPVKIINGDELINSINRDAYPWDLSNLRGKIQQNGKGGYFLCRDCNANTGSWYVPHFEDFMRSVYSLILNSTITTNDAIILQGKRIKPLPIFKEIMVMFCDINKNCFGDENLRSFLLEKESSVPFDDKKYRVFCYITKGEVFRMNGLSVILLSSGKSFVMSEISSIPLGIALYIDLPDDVKPKGCEITSFSKFRYNDEIDCEMILPVLETNTMFSGDYRTKEEIKKTIEQNRKIE